MTHADGSQMQIDAAASSRQLVKRYLDDLGLRICTWPQIGDDKGPRIDGWQLKRFTLDDYKEGYRVGVLTGEEIAPGKFNSDVDIDWAPGSAVAQRLLPPTEFVFGHGTKRVSHCFYTTSEPLVSFKYEDIDKTCLIELRGTKLDGTVGLQTMVPPSIWTKTNEGRREPLTFVKSRALAHIDSASFLAHRVCLAAIAMLFAKHFSRHGFGHEARLCWAGFLLGAGLPIDDCVAIGEAISIYTENAEVHDVRLVVESTAKNISTKQKHVKGRRALAKLLGDKGKQILKRVSEWLGRAEPDGIVMRGGDLSEIVDRAEAALLATTEVYQRGGILTRPIKLDRVSDADHAVRRAAGAIILAPVREAWLLEQMGRAIAWFKNNEQRSRADPEAIYARTLLQRGQWAFPDLRGVVPAPTLTREGRIIERPGYDPDSGLLIDIASGVFPAIPTQPTRAQAEEALQLFSEPLRKFPFHNHAAKAVALAALLTALVRRSLRTAPLIGFDAPIAGSGKSLLAEMTGLLALGVKPAAMSQGKSEEEDEKRLATVLSTGDPIILLDNCERPVAGDFLCSMLTQEMVQARILGLSERRLLPSTALVLATGNNLTLAGDASRRAVVCRLDAQVERPDIREFDFDCHEEVLAARPELVVAGLTVLRAYHVAGRPEKLTPMGSFSDWAWIRGALVWLGCADPADTRSTILENDPRKDELISVMELWEKAFGSAPIAVADIVPGEPPTSAEKGALYTKLIEVACRGKWSGKSVGWWLRRHKDRIVSGRSFRQDQKSERGQLWSLVGAAFATGTAQREPGDDDEDIPF